MRHFPSHGDRYPGFFRHIGAGEVRISLRNSRPLGMPPPTTPPLQVYRQMQERVSPQRAAPVVYHCDFETIEARILAHMQTAPVYQAGPDEWTAARERYNKPVIKYCDDCKQPHPCPCDRDFESVFGS